MTLPRERRDCQTMPAGVTVVIPTHNRPELMSKAVRSVISQTWEGDIEILVVFDACPVELPAVPTSDNRSLRGVSNDRTRGLAGARNTGISGASHDLVAFLDDDDTWMPTKLSRQLDRLSERPDAILIGTAMEVDDGAHRHVRLVPSDDLTHQDFLLNRHPGLHSSSVLVRRTDLLGRLGLIDEELPRSYGEDYDLLLRASAIGPVTVVNEPLIVALWNGQSYYFGRWADYAAALQHLLAKHRDFADIPRAIGRIEAQIAFALAASKQPREARSWAWRALRHDPRQVKAVLACLVSWRLVTAQQVASVAQRLGRGI